MSDLSYMNSNIRAIRERIEAAKARRAGEAADCDVTLLAAIKYTDAEHVNYLHRVLGVNDVGENRVQQLLERWDLLDREDLRVHFIGTLQSNKVKYIAERIAMVQSLDRDSLAEELSRRAQEHGRVIPALIQVNIAREEQKGGVSEEELPGFLRRCAMLPGIHIDGLMAIMPIAEDPESLRPYFRRMRGWFERFRDEGIENVSMNVLSMGMSSDCIVAAQEGATLVRLGRALFGARA